MEMSIHMAINYKSWLLSKVFDPLTEYVKFRAGFHHVSMRAQKDAEKSGMTFHN